MFDELASVSRLLIPSADLRNGFDLVVLGMSRWDWIWLIGSASMPILLMIVIVLSMLGFV